MHALGNNYIYINCFEETLPESELPNIAIKVSQVNTGIGSDGMILICPSHQADFRMRVFNNDGSEAKNCGNGLRCVARYVYDRGLTRNTRFTIETLGGMVEAQINLQDELVTSITIDMGKPRLQKKDVPMQGDPESHTIHEVWNFEHGEFALTALSMGNPHAVIIVDDVNDIDVARIGKEIEFSPLFPERVNVEFIQMLSQDEIDFRVWERGSGITQACGTGACAAVVAGVLNQRLEKNRPVTVHLLGGDLEIVWKDDDRVFMSGPAEFIADGVFYLT
ncbi:diaminopimelate epimerase [Ammoniphilus sp. CFH 90114]|uniref:diaminopimelate epimerase n=1 Tax=Ammoniphilus sp. CFH 90114 TaxID=2493665 RepID=UPI00100F54A8|nr:diaminopimelate epimerase [Ammoniphilus sp. CFH 90114]RXT08170.1 diaminopimelate epimerase [Ammoniphilus sp. CFH 90114]